jgi:DNA-binding transcriptional regulator YhcF (GntR family)
MEVEVIMKQTARNISNSHVPRHLAPRETLPSTEGAQLWRVTQGVLRIDCAPPGEPVRFVRLALPGDVLGVERWAGGHDALSYRALIACRVEAVNANDAAMLPILMDTVVVANQRNREAMELRTGPVAQRLKSMLLMFAQGHERLDAAAVDCPVPNLADLHDILDAAPETISRVFASMREMAFLQGRRPQKVRFSSQVLRAKTLLPGMSSGVNLQRGLMAGA